eukprot:gene3472-3742_t
MQGYQVLGAAALRLQDKLHFCCGCVAFRLCHLTYCATSSRLTFNREALAVAVVSRLSFDVDGIAAASPYDLVMLLRHLCQLAAEPPQGFVVALLPSFVLRMAEMTARLGLQPEPRLVQAGLAALVCSMRKQIAFKELVHLVWAAGALQLNDTGFLRILMAALVTASEQLHPKSIAVVKLVSSYVLAGWVPPKVMSLLGMRAVQLMSSMKLAVAAAFQASSQPLSLLGSLRRMGLTGSEADKLLLAEIARLKAAEQQQQQGLSAAG